MIAFGLTLIFLGLSVFCLLSFLAGAKLEFEKTKTLREVSLLVTGIGVCALILGAIND